MALTLAALSAVQPVALRITVYLRQVFIPLSGDPNPFYVRPHDGRWGTEWTLHTARSAEIAWAEYCRHVPDLVEAADPTGGMGVRAASLRVLGSKELAPPVLARALFALSYDFDRVLDLSGQAAPLAAAGFGAANLYADDYGQCPELARWASAEKYEAILAPSAAWRHPGGVACAVLAPGKSRLRREVLVAESARPTIAVAVATTYKAGQRPRWTG
jgi:hypothetical protein